MLAIALALLVQDAPPSTVRILPPEEPNELERKCVEKHGDIDEAGLMDCLGIIDPRFAPVVEVEEAIIGQHPSQMFVFATRLFHSESRPDDALFWFYTGQLRWRAQMACNPPGPGGEGTALGALMATVGPDINAYAASNVDNWIATINRVLEWDDENPDPLLPEGCNAAREKQRDALKRLAVAIEDQRKDFETATRKREAQAGKR